MRWDNFPDHLVASLIEILEGHLGGYISGESLAEDFHLRESCRFWQAEIADGIEEQDPELTLWHHQVRHLESHVARYRVLTGEHQDSLRLHELGPSKVAPAFHRAVTWLDTEHASLPIELKEEETLVRLLFIRRSFFYGLSFHVDGGLRYVTPIVFPSYFNEVWGAERRVFVTPAELAALLNAAPSFLGIQG